MSPTAASNELLAAWNERSEADRSALAASIVALVAAKLRADTDPWYPGSGRSLHLPR